MTDNINQNEEIRPEALQAYIPEEETDGTN